MLVESAILRAKRSLTTVEEEGTPSDGHRAVPLGMALPSHD